MAKKPGWWREFDGTGWRKVESGNGETNKAEFEEFACIMREKGGDKGAVVIAPRNQETDKETRVAPNLSGNPENLNVAIDSKRRRTEIGQHIMDNGPSNMIIDGLMEEKSDNSNTEGVSKNFYGVGSGHQAHREL